jgi:hypothetical protein
MKTYKQYLQIYENTGINSSWTKGKITVTLKDLLKIIKDYPIYYIDPLKLSKYIIFDDNKERVINSDLNYPSIVIVNNNNIEYVLDGFHRIQKALENNIQKVKVKFVDLNDLNSDFKYVFKKKST